MRKIFYTVEEGDNIPSFKNFFSLENAEKELTSRGWIKRNDIRIEDYSKALFSKKLPAQNIFKLEPKEEYAYITFSYIEDCQE
jgi:hypothetical protein